MNGFRREKLILIVSNLNDYLSNSFVVRLFGAINFQFNLNKAFLICPMQNVISPNSFITGFCVAAMNSIHHGWVLGDVMNDKK